MKPRSIPWQVVALTSVLSACSPLASTAPVEDISGQNIEPEAIHAALVPTLTPRQINKPAHPLHKRRGVTDQTSESNDPHTKPRALSPSCCGC